MAIIDIPMDEEKRILSIAEIVSQEVPDVKFITTAVSKYKNSKEHREKIETSKYLDAENVEILKKDKFFIDGRGIKIKLPMLSNNRLIHPFILKMIRQKVSYCFSKPFSFSSNDETYDEILKTYFDSKFMKMLKRVGYDAIGYAVAFIKVEYDSDGNLNFVRLNPVGCKPFWKDNEHEELDAFIYTYDSDIWTNGDIKRRKFVEYYNKSGVWKYMYDGNGLSVLSDYKDGKGNFILEKPKTDENGIIQYDENGNQIKEEEEVVWKQIPIIPFKYNQNEVSLLKMVKSLNDAYDNTTSMLNDIIDDVPNSIKIIKNFDGTNKEEFIKNLAVLRSIFVSGDGGVDILKDELDSTAIEAHLTRLRKDIYDFGSCVDVQNEDVGNTSGESIKMRSSDLESDCYDLLAEFTESLDRVLYFINADIMLKTGVDFSDVPVDFQFNTDFIVNESDVVEMAKNSTGIISQKTIIENHPWVKNVNNELERIKEENMESMDVSDDSW